MTATSPANILRATALAAALGCLTATFPGAAYAAPEVNQNGGVGISGYDPVGYFSDKKPVKGAADITYSYAGVTYRFASAANRDAFAAAPANYLPQYGGYCAYGLSQGYKAPIDPAAFTLKDGKLYLNYNLDVQSEWRKDTTGYIAKAEKNWPTVRAQ